jgi:hypothetical protein
MVIEILMLKGIGIQSVGSLIVKKNVIKEEFFP